MLTNLPYFHKGFDRPRIDTASRLERSGFVQFGAANANFPLEFSRQANMVKKPEDLEQYFLPLLFNGWVRSETSQCAIAHRTIRVTIEGFCSQKQSTRN
jgi:hypothetical protein